jgi:dienelactone hydrolase
MGYVAMAVDFYGNQKFVDNPANAQSLATPFYTNPMLGKSRIADALALIKMNPYADTNRIAAIGYCFGGAQVLNAARLGENLNGVVSFHGDLVGVTPTRLTTLAKILVCHGEADQFVDSNQVRTFKHQMDSVGANYTFKSYANATHAFTNPDATAVGLKNKMPIEYNAAADSASWQDMKKFFKEIF